MGLFVIYSALFCNTVESCFDLIHIAADISYIRFRVLALWASCYTSNIDSIIKSSESLKYALSMVMEYV